MATTTSQPGRRSSRIVASLMSVFSAFWAQPVISATRIFVSPCVGKTCGASFGLTGGTCFGDSGGPNFLNDTNIVVAVTSFGLNGNCKGTGWGYRVDQSDDLDWLYSTFGDQLN